MFFIYVKQDTLRHFLRRTKGLKIILGIPKEEERVMSSDDDIASYYSVLCDRIQAVPAAFIFNVDETGCSRWTDKRELHVVVPEEEPADTVDIPMSRNCKRHTLTACIAGDGAVMKPFIIVNRKTIDQALVVKGHGRRNVMFAHQPHAFMTRVLFDLWMEEIFIKELHQKKLEYGYKGRSILILDGCSFHESPKINYLCESNQVDLITLPAHTSDRTQPLDLLFFSIFKTHFSNAFDNTFRDRQSNDICRMTRAMKAAAAYDIVVSSFERAGLMPTFGSKRDVILQ
jgi:hypothetical protein